MEAGLLVELSPKEEIALRRVAQGIVEQNTQSSESIERLKALMLVEGKGEKVVLTELGKARLAGLTRHQRYIDPNSSEFEAALAKALHMRNNG